MMQPPTSGALVIRSAEGVSFSLPLAGPLTRFLAWAIDLAAILSLYSIIDSITAIFGLISPDVYMGFIFAFHFFLMLAYSIVLEWFWRGQTLGKRVMRLRVKDQQGLKLRFDQVMLRNLVRVVDILPALYLVGGLSCLITRHNQRLGDIAAGTVVVYEPRTYVPDLNPLTGDKYNSFRNYPHLEARLRQLTPPAASALALEALARRAEMDPGDRVVVFSDLAGYFRSLVRFADEDVMGMTDEQYIRNAVDAIYNTRRPA